MDTTDLLTLIHYDTQLKRVAATNGGEYAGACPFCGGRDRFRVWPNHPGGVGRWWCRQCHRSGDATAYLVERGILTRTQAAAVRRAENPLVDYRRISKPELPQRSAEPPSTTWQTRAQQFVAYAEAQLQDNSARPWQELRQWGLTDETVRLWHLGWNPRDLYDDPVRWGLQGKRIYLPCGITIPHFVDQQVWSVKIRRYQGWQPASAPKYIQPRHGDAGDTASYDTLFGVDLLLGVNRTLLLTEGEKDCLLAWQELHDLTDVAALCGAAKTIPARWMGYLLPYARIFVAYDNDRAGWDGSAKLAQQSGRLHSIRVPIGEDLVDFVQRGGDLRAWFAFQVAHSG